MSRVKAPVVIGVIAVVAIIASAGIGFAVYNGNTYSENNTMAVSVDRVDILKNTGPNNYILLNEKITMPEYRAGNTVEITGYAVATSSNSGNITICCDMGESSSNRNSSYWALIESMCIWVGGSSTPFGKIVDQGDVITRVTSDPISMSSATEYTLGGKIYYYRPFTIEITFSDFSIGDDKDFERLSTFAGSSFVFEYYPA